VFAGVSDVGGKGRKTRVSALAARGEGKGGRDGKRVLSGSGPGEKRRTRVGERKGVGVDAKGGTGAGKKGSDRVLGEDVAPEKKKKRTTEKSRQFL